jgi:phosphohistidine phosphatase
MRLLVIRHAIAGDRETFAAETGRPDAERPVTSEGRKKMKAAARGLRLAAPDIDVLGSSPYVRARQTAEIVADAYDQLPITEVSHLASGGSREGVLEWLRGQRAEVVAVVGHEPDLGALIGWLVTGDAAPFVTLKKGGVGLLEFPDAPGPGLAELRWLLPPKLLTRLGE